VKSWRKNWSELTHFFEYSKNIRKLMYTTNIVEGFNRQIRKITKTKGVFTNQMALMKLIYLTQKDITKKWINPTNNWNRIKQELIIKFGKRFIEN
ncbi:transposase, partial [Tenacibaculum singaporense]|uniref:transposase n=1 Tax=Tenacibaculum singaporense TaxID=2358479 RepID=UPI000F954BC7